ncbi:MAG TPA: hypothetical protein VGE66_17100 [Chitinophagaceae bacterium]
MNRLITERLALLTIATILSLIVLFHLLILTGVMPFDIVWGGRLSSREQMLRFETLSIALNLLMLAVVGARAGIIGRNIPPRLITIALWIMAVLFGLNTVGNLLSQNALERMIFTPLTLILSILCFRLATGKRVKAVDAG